MRPFVIRTLQVAAVAGGFWLLGFGIAQADDTPVNAPVSVCDNHVPVAGTHECVSTEDTSAPEGESTSPQTDPVAEQTLPAPGASDAPVVEQTLPAPSGSDAPAAEAPATSAPAEQPAAEPAQEPSADGSDNPVNPTIHAPVEVCGNAVAVLEDASQECEPEGDSATPEDNESDGSGGFLAGNQINPVINAPITICGNAVGVLADAEAECTPSDQGLSASPGNTTSGEDGVLSGNQLNPVVNAPITVCGNAISVAGSASAGCTPTGQGIGSTGDNTTSGEDAQLLSGNQVNPIANAPVTVCGNAVAVLGDSVAVCDPGDQGTGTGDSGTGDNTTSGDGGNLSGNQADPIVNAPVTVCGNAVGGEAEAICSPGDQGVGGDTGTGDDDTSGEDGNGSGNQISPNVDTPVTVCGNAVAVIEDAHAVCEDDGGQGITPPGDGDDGDDGDGGDGSGPGSGNEINPDVDAPIFVCGNAVSVIGEATAECVEGGGETPPGPEPPVTPPTPPVSPPEPPSGPGAPEGGLPVTGAGDPLTVGLIGLLFLLTGATLVGIGRRRPRTAVGPLDA